MVYSAPTLLDGDLKVELDEDDVRAEVQVWKNSLISLLWVMNFR